MNHLKRCDSTVAWTALRGHFEAHGRSFDLCDAYFDQSARAGIEQLPASRLIPLRFQRDAQHGYAPPS